MRSTPAEGMVAVTRAPATTCADTRELTQEHLKTVRAKLAELKALERSIASLVTNCDASCIGGPNADCVIVDGLSASRCS